MQWVGVFCDQIPSGALGGFRQLSPYYVPFTLLSPVVPLSPRIQPVAWAGRGNVTHFSDKEAEACRRQVTPSRPCDSWVVALDVDLSLLHTPLGCTSRITCGVQRVVTGL